MTEEDLRSQLKNNIKHKKYRKGINEIDRILEKSPHFYSKQVIPLLTQQLTLISKLLIKNVFKREPYEYGFARSLALRALRNLTVLHNLMLEYLRPHIDLNKLLAESLNLQSVDPEIAYLMEKISVDSVTDHFPFINRFLEALLFSCFAFVLMFKQSSRYRESFKVCKLAYDLSLTLKYTKNARLLERIIETKLCYAVFLNELSEYQLSSAVVDEVFTAIMDMFYLKFSNKHVNSRKKMYKYEKMWKIALVVIALNMDNVGNMHDYDRLYESNNFLSWAFKQVNIDSYAFKRCLNIITQQPSKLLDKHIQAADDLRMYAQYYFDYLIKKPSQMEVPQHTQSLYTHFNNLMYDSYKSQRLDKKVITLYQRRDKSEKDSKVSKRNKRSYKVIPNKQYDEDEGMTAMQEDIFKNFKGYTSKRGSHSSTHHGTGSDKTLNNYFQEFVQETLKDKKKKVSLRTDNSFHNSYHDSSQSHLSLIAKSDQNFFKKFIKQSGVEVPSQEHRSVIAEDCDRKQYTFMKRQFKMKFMENLTTKSSNYLNITEEKLRIKQQSEFIFSTCKEKTPPLQDHYIKKDQNGVVVPLTGVKLFVEIILQNRIALGINKLFEKHEMVKKRRECQIKLKKKNQEKQLLKMLYKLEEGKRTTYDEEIYHRLSELRGKRKAKLYKKSPVGQKFCLQNTLDSFQQKELLKKLIAHSNQKSQSIIKKFSETIQENLRDQPTVQAKKVKKGSMLDQKFINLRQSIATEKLTF